MRWLSLLLYLILILAVSFSGCTGPSPSPVPGTAAPAGSTTSTASGTWTFVVYGDTRDDMNTTTGISPVLRPIASAIAAEKPDFILFDGDLITGRVMNNNSPMVNNYTGQFGNWMEAVSPIHNYSTGTGIPIYVIRGNHEDGYADHPLPAILEAYLATVASGMPTNGPPGEEKLTYSFTHKGAKFIAIDEYIPHNGIKNTVNQSWVDGQLTQDTRPFMFVMGHSPAYYVSKDTHDIPTSLQAQPAQRDIFWKSLADNHVLIYFCGHLHMYVRGESQGVQQVIGGNGGAPLLEFDPATVPPALTLEYPLRAVVQSDQKFGYLVITVHEDSGTFEGVQKVLNPVTGAWETGDTFTMKAR